MAIYGGVGRIGKGLTLTMTINTVAATFEITDVQFSGFSRETIDVTSQASPNGWKQFVGGLFDAGEVQITILHETKIWNVLNDASQTVTISLNGQGSFACAAFVTNVDVNVPVESRMESTFSFKFDGEPTITLPT